MNIIDAIINADVVKDLAFGKGFQGIWKSNIAYQVGQVVSANNNIFVCLEENTNHFPTDVDFWNNITMSGPMGPTGPPGIPGIPGGAAFQFVVLAGQTLGGHRCVMLNTGGDAVYADSSDVGHAGRLFGVTGNAANIGDPVTVHTFGEMTESTWAWDVTKHVFLGTNGQLTQVPPTSGFLQVIGQPITAQSLFINPQTAVTLA